ncbi:MAG: hypothetical protein DDT21_02293 [Syntrophomonadaceae bacterium]|nr:hypothetical protein [Bacillota bacterium]
MSDEPIKIAVNRMQLSGKLPQGDSRWAAFNDLFVCQSLPPLDIANAIYTGHAYAGWHNGRRCTENFLCAQHIGVDMDSGDQRSTFDELLQHDFFKTYGGLIHTTPSHTQQSPRARLLFFLDEPITNPTAFQAAATFVVSLFSGADQAVTDASRFFYGCCNCEIEIPFKTLPLAHLRHYYARVTAQNRMLTQPAPQPVKGHMNGHTNGHTNGVSAKECDHLQDIILQRAISRANVEGRNNTGLWLATQLRDNAYTKLAAESIVKSYQRAVERNKPEPYTENEALKTLASAYGRSARTPWEAGKTH